MLRVAVLIKQVPKAEALTLDDAGRLRRGGVPSEINAYCRRAVSQGVELARLHDGHCVVVTLGPPAAEDALREALAWGADRAVLVSDPAFAGSDTLATARALVAAVRRLGDIDLVLTGRNSVDADTGQVGPEVAELLGLPFVGGVRRLVLTGRLVQAHCEQDDGWTDREVALPAVLSCAERLCEPAKVKPEVWSGVPAERIERLAAAGLGAGPWGQAGSPTRVGEVRVHDVPRLRRVLTGPAAEQVAEAMQLLLERGALTGDAAAESARVVPAGPARGNRRVAVVVESGRPHVARELLGAAADLARGAGGRVVAIDAAGEDPLRLAGWGADDVVAMADGRGAVARDVGAMTAGRGADAGDVAVRWVEADVAAGLAGWCERQRPWAVLLPGTMWGREVGGRVAARLGAGLTGDAIDLTVDVDRLVCWKPAFGGRLVAAIRATGPVQLATVRPGALPLPLPRAAAPVPAVETLPIDSRSRVRIVRRGRDDDLDALAEAVAVIGVGMGVEPDDYPLLEPLRAALGAELAATRKVTDRGRLPRDRQVGLTGRSIAPRLYVALGTSGKFNHAVGIRRAGTVLAVNPDPTAPIFEHADVGLVADWREVAGPLAAACAAAAGCEPAHH